MSSPPNPKSVWTAADFGDMGWHDNAVHGIGVDRCPTAPGRLLLDIDYIVEWVDPRAEGGRFRFWVCPATLVFDRASDLTMNMAMGVMAFEPSLDAISRSGPDEYGQFGWYLEGHEFTISVTAPGFTQHLRSPPILSRSQRLDWSERGLPSFAMPAESG